MWMEDMTLSFKHLYIMMKSRLDMYKVLPKHFSQSYRHDESNDGMFVITHT
jgi:hypothetical protein